MSHKFNQGDRVICLRNDIYGWLNGYAGTVVCSTMSDSIGVCFDIPICEISSGRYTGHSCDRHCTNGFGWYVGEYSLVHEDDCEIGCENEDTIDLNPEEADQLL